ncbi:MAG: hypothetical protein KDC98_17310, partial [Planctomycetes bacterium]|nr:hypothetical protein [Planctomycetota bacterium]
QHDSPHVMAVSMPNTTPSPRFGVRFMVSQQPSRSLTGLALLSLVAAAAPAQDPPQRPPDAVPIEPSSAPNAPDEGHEPDVFAQLLAGQQQERQYGSSLLMVGIHGFLDFQYVDPDTAASEFDLHHANLFISGMISEQLEAHVEVEYEHASESIELDQAEIRYRPFATHDLTLAAGRFYAPFGIERRTWYPSNRPSVSRPAVFEQVVPGNWYETGIRGDYQRRLGAVDLRAELAVTNGLGPTAATDIRAARQTRDADGSRAVIGRLGAAIADGPAFGLSAATMKYDGAHDIGFLGLDLEQQFGPVLLRGEWVGSEVEDPAGPAGDFRRSGLYVLGSCRVWETDLQSLDLWLRYGRVDPNSGVDDGNDVETFAVGARFTPTAHLAVKLEYLRQNGLHGIDATSPDTFLAQFVVDF